MAISNGALLGAAGISGGSSLLGSVIGGLFGSEQSDEAASNARWVAAYNASANSILQEDAQAFNSEEAQKARDQQYAFEREMSNTAYQRAKADLLAAGYNPLLAVTNGSASTPSGSSASASSPSASVSTGSIPASSSPWAGLSGIGTAVNTALDAYSKLSDINNAKKEVDADVKAKEAVTTKTKVDTVADVVKTVGSGASAAYVGKKVLDSVMKSGAASKVADSVVSTAPTSTSAVSAAKNVAPALNALGMTLLPLGLGISNDVKTSKKMSGEDFKNWSNVRASSYGY